MKKALIAFAAIVSLSVTVSGQGFSWTDGFESYVPGTLCATGCTNASPANGGWDVWDAGTPTAAPPGTVNTTYARTGANSLAITGSTDQVQPWNLNSPNYPQSGCWTLTVHQYLDSANFVPGSGDTYVIVNNNYNHGGPYGWVLQLKADPTLGVISDLDRPGITLPVILDQWVEIRVEIDLDADTLSSFYGGQLLSTGIYNLNLVSPAGSPSPQAIANLDLYAAGTTNVAYYDDCSLVPAAATWETNGPSSHLDINGATNNQCGPIDVTICTGQLASVNSMGVAGNGWDMGISLLPGVPLGGGALPTPGGQIVNLDFSAGLPTFLYNLLFNVPHPGSLTFPVNLGTGLDIYAQQINLDPGHPSGDGFAVSAFCGLHVRDQTVITGPQSDDGFLQVNLASTCGAPATLYFAGTGYSDFFINSNGSISFGAGDGSFIASVAAFQAGAPKLAGMWTDLAPNAGGLIQTTVQAGTITCSFQSVPEWGAANANSFDMFFDGAQPPAAPLCAIQNYAPDPTHGTDTLVGITVGGAGGATDPGAVSFAALVGLGPQVSALPTDMVYEFVFGGAPSGFSSITFPNSDGSIYDVN